MRRRGRGPRFGAGGGWQASVQGGAPASQRRAPHRGKPRAGRGCAAPSAIAGAPKPRATLGRSGSRARSAAAPRRAGPPPRTGCPRLWDASRTCRGHVLDLDWARTGLSSLTDVVSAAPRLLQEQHEAPLPEVPRAVALPAAQHCDGAARRRSERVLCGVPRATLADVTPTAEREARGGAAGGSAVAAAAALQHSCPRLRSARHASLAPRQSAPSAATLTASRPSQTASAAPSPATAATSSAGTSASSSGGGAEPSQRSSSASAPRASAPAAAASAIPAAYSRSCLKKLTRGAADARRERT